MLKIFDCSGCVVSYRPYSQPGSPLACDPCVCLYMGTGLGDVIIISACYQTTIRISTLYWDQFSYGTCPSLSHTNVIWSFLHHLGQVWEWNQLSLCNSLSLSLSLTSRLSIRLVTIQLNIWGRGHQSPQGQQEMVGNVTPDFFSLKIDFLDEFSNGE